MKLTIEVEMETDGRWIAEVMDKPGAMAYGATLQEAVEKAVILARKVTIQDYLDIPR